MSPDRHALSRRLFIHALGAVLFIAFASLRVQLDGLVGSRGIWPAAKTIEALRPLGFAHAPTLFFFTGATDRWLHAACDLGLGLSALLAAGLFPLPLLLLCWALYLSLTLAGGPFMGFQWESLLLESAQTAALFCLDRPLRPLWRSSEVEPPRLARWLQLWLLARLLFLSAWVKLASGDPTWRELRALDFHYFTQPLPSPMSWSAHQLTALHRSATAVMFAIEFAAPLLLFIPGRARRAGALAIALLQLGILATGNYGFFNLLTIALCLPALDDAFLRRMLRLRANPPVESAPRQSRAPALVSALAALFIIPVSAAEALQRIAPRLPLPAPLVALAEAAAPLRSINSYGLFAVMTTERDEILLEGSRDGVEWRAYRFRYKPGPLEETPRQVAPHQPRLDWQLWFAALGSFRRNPWYLSLLERLLQGEPAVLALLADDPFPEGPPRYLRSRFFRYRFSTREERRRDGHVWEREELEPYAPTVMLEDGRLAAAPPLP